MKKLLFILLLVTTINSYGQDRVNEPEYKFIKVIPIVSTLWDFNSSTGKWESNNITFFIKAFEYNSEIIYTISSYGEILIFYHGTHIVKYRIPSEDYYIFSKVAFADFLIGNYGKSVSKKVQVPKTYSDNKTIRKLLNSPRNDYYAPSLHYKDVFRFYFNGWWDPTKEILNGLYYEISKQDFNKIIKLIQDTCPELNT